MKSVIFSKKENQSKDGDVSHLLYSTCEFSHTATESEPATCAPFVM